MCCTSTFSCITTMAPNFTMFFIYSMFILKYFIKKQLSTFEFWYELGFSFVNNFIFFFLKLFVFIACSLKYPQNFFIESLPLYTSCLFSLLSNDDFVDIEKLEGTCSLTFVVDEFSGLFFHPSIFSIKHSRSS